MDAFNRWVFDNFASHTTVTATHNQHILGIRMTAKRQKRNHFLIGKFILLRALNDSIQYQRATMCFPGN